MQKLGKVMKMVS